MRRLVDDALQTRATAAFNKTNERDPKDVNRAAEFDKARNP
jgi:hypothetical protein